jgi:hypothetical protein
MRWIVFVLAHFSHFPWFFGKKRLSGYPEMIEAVVLTPDVGRS